ncbi:hypothetical protein GCK72_019512 [Caenorhabditis remanei]|uniref:Uncharacterized protein n=1 Tax=Caenorhabditis remanei TaxID=31234 RepID=A0A6A5GCI0_CAERE|nr:hypothetical protein GCK72_019512 [Caenorhabditis remanei]KAF1752957.1 hypothetical protein GCK72_019512 [Caenorhabditis remanei]
MKGAIFLFLVLISFSDTCLVVRSPSPVCKCPPIGLFNQSDVERNAGGYYLGNRPTWHPVNRVVNNENVFGTQPRNIGNLKCELHTDGTYQWYFHGYPMFDMSLGCQEDTDSCSCPEIKGNSESGVTLTERFPDTPDQCYFYEGSCSNDSKEAFVYSKNEIISTGTVTREVRFEDLLCVKDYDNNFDWYFFNEKLENVSIGCSTIKDAFGSDEVCACGAFPIITTVEQLENYDKTNKYRGRIIGANSWTPSCAFNVTCDDGYVGVVFSDSNEPVELTISSYITCTYNPITNYLRIWVVNSVRVLNPAAACLKINGSFN